MGKAIITQNNGNGWYFADEVYDNSWGAAMLSKITTEKSSLSSNKTIKINTRSNLITAREGLDSTLNTAINDGTDTKDIVKSLEIIDVDIFKLTREINTLQTRINDINVQVNLLSSASEVRVPTTAWSADYSVSIPNGTVVGIVDRKRSDQLHNFITIQPTYRDGDTDGYLWDAGRDGVLQFKDGAPSTGWAYNYAMANGADTWIPRYIYADISTIDYENNSCTFTTDDFFANSIPPDGKGNLIPLPATFEYMECDSLSFIVGNAIVIDVSNENNYVVIGFQKLPVNCPLPLFLGFPQFITITVGNNMNIYTYIEQAGIYNPAPLTGDGASKLIERIVQPANILVASHAKSDQFDQISGIGIVDGVLYYFIENTGVQVSPTFSVVNKLPDTVEGIDTGKFYIPGGYVGFNSFWFGNVNDAHEQQS